MEESGRGHQEHPDAPLPDCVCRNGHPDIGLPLLLLGVLWECYSGHSNDQRTSPGTLHQERTSENLVNFQNDPSLVWGGPAAALGCWADVPIKTGPAGMAQVHSKASPNGLSDHGQCGTTLSDISKVCQ